MPLRQRLRGRSGRRMSGTTRSIARAGSGKRSGNRRSTPPDRSTSRRTRSASGGNRRWLIAFGAMWIGQAVSNAYFLIFFPILLALWIAWFLTSGGRIGRAAVVAAAWVGATLPLAPIVVRYYHVGGQFAVERTYGEIRGFSAPVEALLWPAPPAIASTFLPSNGDAEQQLFPGIAIIALVIVAVGVAVRRAATAPARRSPLRMAVWTVAAGSLAVAATAPLVGPWRIDAGAATILSVTTAMKPLTVALWCGVLAIATSTTMATAWAERSAFAFYALAAATMYTFSFGPEPTLLGVPFWYRAPYAWLLE